MGCRQFGVQKGCLSKPGRVSLADWQAVQINNFTSIFVERCTVVLCIIDIKADVDYILFHIRLRFCLMV